MSSSLQWKEPPPDGRAERNNYATVAAELRKHPGKWALVAANANTSSYTWLRRNHMPPPHFEVITRREGCEAPRTNVYARYLNVVRAGQLS